MDRVFYVVPGKGIGVLARQLQCVGACLLRRYLTGDTLLGHILGTHAHGQAFTKRTGLKQVGNADLVTAEWALKHALIRFALKGRAAEGAGNAHMRRLLELLRRSAIFPQQVLQNRLIAPVRIKEIPIRVLRAIELRHMGELEQAVDDRQRRLSNAQGALGLSRIGLPGNDRAAIDALKAALSLVRVHGAAAVLAFNGKHLVHGNVLLCAGAVKIKYVEQTGTRPYPCGPKWSAQANAKSHRTRGRADSHSSPPRAR